MAPKKKERGKHVLNSRDGDISEIICGNHKCVRTLSPAPKMIHELF